MRVPNGSTIKVITAVSPSASTQAAGSANPKDLAGYYGAMMIVTVGSGNNLGAGKGLVVSVARSATSNGTFNQFGASTIALATGSGQTYVRNFLVNTSCTWHQVSYDQNNGGAVNFTVHLLAMRGPFDPVPTQDSSTTVGQDVLVG
jgi:hypothetical protein